MSSSIGLLCHKYGDDALAYKYGGNALIYKRDPDDSGSDPPGTPRTVIINVMWDPVNWVCDYQHENHLMYGAISCSVASGAATPGQSSTSQVGENMFTYTCTQFPTIIDVSMRFNAACAGQQYPPVTVFVAAACKKEMQQYQALVTVPTSGQATKTVSVSVDQSGNLEIT